MSRTMLKESEGPISIYVAGTMSGSEGRVTWGGPHALTCSCLPIEPKNVQFRRVVERNISGSHFYLNSPETLMWFTPTSQNSGILRVSGSLNFDQYGQFLVEYVAPGKDSMGVIINDAEVTGSTGWEENYAYLPLQTYESVALQFSASIPEGGDEIRIRLDGTVDDESTLSERLYMPVTLDFVKVSRDDDDELSGSVYVISGTGDYDETFILKSEPVLPLTALRIAYSSSVEEGTSALKVFTRRIY